MQKVAQLPPLPAGLARIQQDIEHLAEHAIRLRNNAADDTQLPVGASKLGGAPDLPPVADATATIPATGQGAAAPNDGACPPQFPIKGNIRSDGAKIYHLPNDPTYARTHAEQCFAAASDAQAAGFRAPR